MPIWEEWADDVRAVLDGARSEQAAVLAETDGGPTCVLFTAMHPERVTGLILANTTARRFDVVDANTEPGDRVSNHNGLGVPGRPPERADVDHGRSKAIVKQDVVTEIPWISGDGSSRPAGNGARTTPDRHSQRRAALAKKGSTLGTRPPVPVALPVHRLALAPGMRPTPTVGGSQSASEGG
jgi:pimeloyl-ACP methyl ester carboxylesterase